MEPSASAWRADEPNETGYRTKPQRGVPMNPTRRVTGPLSGANGGTLDPEGCNGLSKERLPSTVNSTSLPPPPDNP